ncbi:hypothetical protein [Cypionkella sinensis]|uniref:DUF560 domain-containing protein n=1 Tax=Cypionkella sinensis TaxID=1756043 RepID=A0ABV7ISI1_9RHOB
MSGNAQLARALAAGLLQADPNDPYALLIMTASETQLGRPAEGRKAGRAAWVAARGLPDGLRYDIARYTALAALQEGRVLPTQLWLRRALDVAPTSQARAQTINDYKALREKTRLRYAIDLSLTPSDNLNDGASSKYLSIDDWFVLGMLSGSAQALSGLRADARVRLIYRLRESSTSQTSLGFGAAASRNFLSDEAKLLAPDLRGRDLDQSAAEFSITQDFLWPQSQHPISTTLALGQIWQAGTVAGPYLRMQLATPLLQRPEANVRVEMTAQRSWRSDSTIDASAMSLEGQHQLGGGVFSWGMAISDVVGTGMNQSYNRGSASLGYKLDKPIGPVTLATNLTAGKSHYDIYRLLGAQVTKGRTDTQFDLSIDMTFPNIGVMGYAPTLSVSKVMTQSNISRFESNGLNISVGFTSQF